MKTTVKHLSDTSVQLTIALTKKELTDAELVATRKLAKELKVPGFRKGRVPIEVAKKHIDPRTRDEHTLENAVSKAVAEAFTAEKIQALERPNVELKKFVPGETLEFTAETQVIPVVKLGNYKMLKVATPKLTVTKAEIDEVVDRILASMTERKTVKRAAKLGDEVVIDYEGKKDGVAFDGGTATGHTLALGSGSFIPGFEDALVGHRAGETLEVPLTFPAEYHAAELAGAETVFNVTINEVKEAKAPVLTDELAAKAGPFTSAKELRDNIKRELLAQKEREHTEKTKDDILKQLVDKSKVPVPAVLVADQARSIEQDMTQNLNYRGQTIDQYVQQSGFADHDDWMEKQVKPAATTRVQVGLVLAELSKELKISASSEELAERIEQLRKQYENDPDTAKRFEEPEVQREVANRILTEKTIEKLLELNAPVKATKK